MRVRAAVDARDAGEDILIMARTDAAHRSLDEAIARCRLFREIGADITFLEAPTNEARCAAIVARSTGRRWQTSSRAARTPLLPPARLEAIGYAIAVYPLTMLNVSIQAMRSALANLRTGERAAAAMEFDELKQAVGPRHHAEEARYKV